MVSAWNRSAWEPVCALVKIPTSDPGHSYKGGRGRGGFLLGLFIFNSSISSGLATCASYTMIEYRRKSWQSSNASVKGMYFTVRGFMCIAYITHTKETDSGFAGGSIYKGSPGFNDVMRRIWHLRISAMKAAITVLGGTKRNAIDMEARESCSTTDGCSRHEVERTTVTPNNPFETEDTQS